MDAPSVMILSTTTYFKKYENLTKKTDFTTKIFPHPSFTL